MKRPLFPNLPVALLVSILLVLSVPQVLGAVTNVSAERLALPQQKVGHPLFLSPHAKPILIHGSYLYVTNTAADTVDVIDTRTLRILKRIHVGIDPVALALRPDGSELWVSNHVSDTVSVIDTRLDSASLHEVLATISDWNRDTLATAFDEPVGIAFASDSKAYVALSSTNRIAVIDVAAREVTQHLSIRSQDPRAITVSGNRLYVIPFESGNRSQLSGCDPVNHNSVVDGDLCTFDADKHVRQNNNVLSAGYDADIVINPKVPDRDLYVFDTQSDQIVDIVDTLGTMLYDIAADDSGQIYITQADARNAANGRAGTLMHGLADMENRAFLNRVARAKCEGGTCRKLGPVELEPLPPEHPQPGASAATPYALQLSPSGDMLFITAASANQVLAIDVSTGDVVGRAGVGAVPRGIALQSDAGGHAEVAWVYSVVSNTVERVDVSSPRNLRLTESITLTDPTDPVIKLGRMAFNDAGASTTGTFSCESCHPDGHTDQLLWVLDAPACDIQGCTQTPPRTTMPIRGLRDTAPYHWDGIPGDPYGGNNTANINGWDPPNCSEEDPVSCTRDLVDGSMASTMCLVGSCGVNDEGKAGNLTGAERDALAEFLLHVPYPPARERSITNQLSEAAVAGFRQFHLDDDCGACHRMPFWVSTNSPDHGMDVPTWRGANDRWLILPQGRWNVVELRTSFDIANAFPEQFMWGASNNVWQMVQEGSTGFGGAFGRQLTLNTVTASQDQTMELLEALEQADLQGAVQLQAEGIRFGEAGAERLRLAYANGAYERRGSGIATTFSRESLLADAQAGRVLLTLTGRAGANAGPGHAQPAIWAADIPIQQMILSIGMVERMAFPTLRAGEAMRISARHIQPGVAIFINGQRQAGSVECEVGVLPQCENEHVLVRLDEPPSESGMHFLQLQNPRGLFSNDFIFFR